MNESRTFLRQAINSMLYLTPALFGSGASLLTLPILTRLLSTEHFGFWGLASGYASVVVGLANFGLIIGFERNFFEASTSRARGKLLYSVILFVSCSFGVFGLATWVARKWLAATLMGAPAFGDLLVVCFAAQGLSSLKLYFLSYYKNTHDARSYVRYTLDETVMGSVFSVILVAGFRVGVIGLAAGPLIASAVVFGLLARRFFVEVPFGLSLAALGSALRVSLPLAPRVLLSGVSSQFDKYILGFLGTIGAVGIFTIGQRIAGFVGTAMNALQNVYLPQVYERMFEGPPGDPSRVIGAYLTPYAYCSIGAALAVALFADEAILLLTTRAYRGAGLIASILAISHALAFFGRQPQLQFVRRMYLIAGLSVISLVWTTVLIAIGTKWIGAPGTAAGSLAAATLTSVVGLAFAQHYNPISYEWRILLTMFAPLAAAPALAALYSIGVLPYPAVLLMKLALIALFLNVGRRLDYFTASRLHEVVGMVQGRRRTS